MFLPFLKLNKTALGNLIKCGFVLPMQQWSETRRGEPVDVFLQGITIGGHYDK